MKIQGSFLRVISAFGYSLNDLLDVLLYRNCVAAVIEKAFAYLEKNLEESYRVW